MKTTSEPEQKTEMTRFRLTPSKRAMIEEYVRDQRKAGNPVDNLTKFVECAIWEYLNPKPDMPALDARAKRAGDKAEHHPHKATPRHTST